MTQIKKDTQNKGVNPVAAAAAGVIVGAAGVALMQKNNRKKIIETVGNVKQRAEKVAAKIHTAVEHVESDAEDSVDTSMDEE